MIKIKRLTTQKEFEEYSDRLKMFEKNFDYPLGEQRFLIQHGQDSILYFDFFKRLGEVFYFVIEDKNQIIGAGCAVLRTINYQGYDEKIWYLCDFKILKEYRQQGLLKRITLKYFISSYLKSNKMIAVNMSKKENNGLVKKVNSLFSWFNVKALPFYFFEFNKEILKNILNDKLKKDFVLLTNKNYKDIVIENKVKDIYHLVPRQYAENNFKNLIIEINENTITELNNDTLFMFSTIKQSNVQYFKHLGLNYNYESSFICHKVDDIDFCSFEI